MAGARIIITRIADSAALAKELEAPMRRLANQMHRRAQRVVPKRTWRLHDTLTSDVVREGSKVTAVLGVGGPTDYAPNGAPYWEHVEHGTSRQRAQPYLRPALNQSKAADMNNRTEPNKPRGGAR